MAEKSDIDDSSVKPENFNTTDSKWEKDDSPQSYQEWDNDKLIAIIQSLTSGLELGRGALSALKGKVAKAVQPRFVVFRGHLCVLVEDSIG